jgi:predicted ATPase
MLVQSMIIKESSSESYPFHLSFINQKITFHREVTILIGENGSGKSTLLDLLSRDLGLYRIGTPITELPKVKMEISYQLSKPKGIYFSSEDFTTYIHEIEKEKKIAIEEIERVKVEYQHRSKLAQNLASMPHHRSLSELSSLHDRDLLKSSHGEAYLSFFKSRIRKNQLMLLDEPETPLSFSNQLALLLLMKEAVNQGCQLIIASHSPVVMSYPNADLYEIDEKGIHLTSIDQVESISLMKQFLNNPDAFLHHLFFEPKERDDSDES